MTGTTCSGYPLRLSDGSRYNRRRRDVCFRLICAFKDPSTWVVQGRVFYMQLYWVVCSLPISKFELAAEACDAV